MFAPGGGGGGGGGPKKWTYFWGKHGYRRKKKVPHPHPCFFFLNAASAAPTCSPGDATDFFEDVGHSISARKLLAPLLLIPAPPPLVRGGAAAAAREIGERKSAAKSRETRPWRPPPRPPPRLVLVSSRNRCGDAARARAEAAAAKLAPFAAGQTKALLEADVCLRCGAARRITSDEKTQEAGGGAGEMGGLWAGPGAAAGALCWSRRAHQGRCRVFFDPFRGEWGCWWTCCHAAAVLRDV